MLESRAQSTARITLQPPLRPVNSPTHRAPDDAVSAHGDGGCRRPHRECSSNPKSHAARWDGGGDRNGRPFPRLQRFQLRQRRRVVRRRWNGPGLTAGLYVSIQEWDLSAGASSPPWDKSRCAFELATSPVRCISPHNDQDMPRSLFLPFLILAGNWRRLGHCDPHTAS
jgi:hypothetical protein